MHILKKEKNRCVILAGFEASNKIQPQDYSRGGGKDGIMHVIVGRERELERQLWRLERERELC